MLGATVGKVIAVHRGNDHIAEVQVLYGLGQMQRFFRVEGVGATETDVTEGAAASTDVAHDHEGGGAAAKTFRQVRAGGFFADSVQFLLAQQTLDALNLAIGRNSYANPVGLALIAGFFVDHGDGAYLVRTTQLVTNLNLAFGLCLLAHEVSVTVCG